MWFRSLHTSDLTNFSAHEMNVDFSVVSMANGNYLAA